MPKHREKHRKGRAGHALGDDNNDSIDRTMFIQTGDELSAKG